jgi:hypothetical protein
MKQKEQNLAKAISIYLQAKKGFENSLDFRFDVGADVKLTIGQAKKLKALQGEERGFPDLTVFLKNGKTFFFELKKDKSEIYKKNGEFKENKHILEQRKRHERLNKLGFNTFFIWSFKQFREILNNLENNLENNLR